MTFEESFGDYKSFLEKILANLELAKIDITDSQIDHVAFRTTTRGDYEIYAARASQIGKSIGEIQIRNRAVGVWKLNEPLVFKIFTIPYFEILAPAEGDRHFDNALEHVEFVITKDLKDFVNDYPRINFSIKNLNNEINPELILLFPNDANVKFHQKPIDKVVEIEKEHGLIRG